MHQILFNSAQQPQLLFRQRTALQGSTFSIHHMTTFSSPSPESRSPTTYASDPVPLHTGLSKYDTSHDCWYVPGTLPLPPVSRERAQHRIQQLYSPGTSHRVGCTKLDRAGARPEASGLSLTVSKQGAQPALMTLSARLRPLSPPVLVVFPVVGRRSIRVQALEFLCPLRGCSQRPKTTEVLGI